MSRSVGVMSGGMDAWVGGCLDSGWVAMVTKCFLKWGSGIQEYFLDESFVGKSHYKSFQVIICSDGLAVWLTREKGVEE